MFGLGSAPWRSGLDKVGEGIPETHCGVGSEKVEGVGLRFVRRTGPMRELNSVVDERRSSNENQSQSENRPATGIIVRLIRRQSYLDGPTCHVLGAHLRFV
jgi:hypothetical protein